ncbi:5-(carboxyamino)imidazole ribonucleotide mutase [Halobacterium salinarum]|uniref:5-(carboxyamino)imidazole ribonucleotide mutase n=1 Tax=Halobacterium salinarum TaxID=2242 RepID=UPI001F17D268|nr:5-(carboxyamino)imidazole ribonucleotide mutase [Halobacterium salinarum]MCF2165701.1 5-(carboxyamino)imidazole ribonucleotide mutase [Halobacterium salinarum]MCF2166571.1 5-(carboxyamino)imidazole ribonucleotide mutase [Halobacterium salinarum]MCF2238364.1 5-(carboxyamino)imidazole ribonucleotide mutase [Halobacterium salinarum]
MTTVSDLIDLFETEAAADHPPDETPDVGVIMGSDSDLDVMAGAHDALTDLGFTELTDYDDPPTGYTFESWVVSAHRTPALMDAYARTAAARGLDVIIAGAGGKSADLPNMTASLAYPIPVVGVPVQEKSVSSVIGMPTGAPITAVDAGKSYNAGLAAAQFLATDDPTLADRLRDLQAARQEGVADVSARLHSQGTDSLRSPQN